VVIGAHEGFSEMAARAQKHAVLPNDFVTVRFRNVWEMLDNQRGDDMARQKAPETEAEGKSAARLEVVLGLVGRQQRGDDHFSVSKSIGDLKRDHGVCDNATAISRIL
jgi:hypothetical protein